MKHFFQVAHIINNAFIGPPNIFTQYPNETFISAFYENIFLRGVLVLLIFGARLKTPGKVGRNEPFSRKLQYYRSQLISRCPLSDQNSDVTRGEANISQSQVRLVTAYVFYAI